MEHKENNEQIIKVLSFILTRLDTLEIEQSRHKEMFHKVRKNLTNANDLPDFRKLINFGIFLYEFSLLKLISLLSISNLFMIFPVCLVSSHAIKETFLRIDKALKEISSKLPIGVPTIYKTLCSGSCPL